MSNTFVNVGVAVGGVSSLTIDAGYIVQRVVNLLQRSDLNVEALHWLNFAYQELVDRVDFPELRTAVEADLIPSPATYAYDLPSDWSRVEDIYYRNTTVSSNIWGKHLVPLPQKFYSGDTVDFERLLNMSIPSTGDLEYFFIEGNRLLVYPALAPDLTGTLQMGYYKIPPDLTSEVDIPAIDKRWRQYLVWLTLYWGMVMLEKEDVAKAFAWQKRFDQVVSRIRNMIDRKENVRHEIAHPAGDLEDADRVY